MSEIRKTIIFQLVILIARIVDQKYLTIFGKEFPFLQQALNWELCLENTLYKAKHKSLKRDPGTARRGIWNDKRSMIVIVSNPTTLTASITSNHL